MGSLHRVGVGRRLRVVAVIGSVALALVLTGCTSSTSPVGPSTTVRTQTVVSTSTPPVVRPTPISAGPTTAAAASVCPLLTQQTAADQVGLRLDRITVLRSGGKLVGCRLYALQHPNASCSAACLKAEVLPGPNQPAVEILTSRYASATAAHNAFVLASGRTNVQQEAITPGNIGLCYQIRFWAKDNGKDWACGFSLGNTAVLVRTVVDDEAGKVKAVATEIAGKL